MMKLKNFVVAMCAATMMIAGATVASAISEVKVEIDAVNDTTAVVNVYATATEADYKTLTINTGLYDGATEVSKTYFASATVDNKVVAGNAARAMLHGSKKYPMITGSDSDGLLTWGSDGLVASFTITLNTPLKNGLELKVDKATYSTMTNTTAVNVASLVTDTVVIAPPAPTYEDKYVDAVDVPFAALGDNEVAGTDVAAAYKASYTFAGTEKAAAWTATGKGDYAIDLANLSGETTLGLIVTDGVVSDVQLKVTAQAN